MDFRQQVIDLGQRRADLDCGSTRPGRPYHLLDHPPGVLGLVVTRRGRNENGLRAGRFPLSNFSGRLSSAEGQAEAVSTRVSLRERSPAYMAPTCGTETWDSSITSSASSGR